MPMYDARFVSDSGATFSFGFSGGTVFDIDPLSGVDVKISTSQGFQQIGETVTGMSVAGVKRKISGAIYDKKNDAQIARRMQKALSSFTRGRLYIGDRYCDAVVEKTPEFIREKSGRLSFSLQVYCPQPYWLNDKATVKELGGYIPAFSFPVTYDTHAFGVKAPSAFVNCETDGEVDVPYTVRFTTTSSAENIGLIDIHTMAYIKVADSIVAGEMITIGRENGHLYVKKTAADGTETDIFALLDESSTLFFLRAGDNVLKATADDGEDSLIVYVEYSSAYVGVVV